MKHALVACLFALTVFSAFAADTVIVRPKEIDDVLVNPGIGFITFQRFNGDSLNEGLKWTEGFPIAYQEFKGSLKNPNFPDTSIAYFRIYWKFIEPEQGKYRWDLIDNALRYSPNNAQVVVSVAIESGQAVLRVQDSGAGMTEPEIARLGERFYRVLGSDQPGSGLGWSIVKRIATVFGAQVHVSRSERLGGLAVAVRWPR